MVGVRLGIPAESSDATPHCVSLDGGGGGSMPGSLYWAFAKNCPAVSTIVTITDTHSKILYIVLCL